MGAAGDMLMGALLELHPDKEDFLRRINTALDGKAMVCAAEDHKCGIRGTHVSVMIGDEEELPGDLVAHTHSDGSVHSHRVTTVHSIGRAIDSMALPHKVKNNAKAVYSLIAKAESTVHGEDIEHIHFHEVGTLDALADVLGVCMLIDELGVSRIQASPVRVGFGTVKCAHGVLPVPAPATEQLLHGIPIFAGDIKGEMCTPTGAALLAYFVEEFGEMPAITVEKSGYGTGKKDFPAANVVRAFLGEVRSDNDDVIELRCNIDDMTGEELGFAMDELFAAGALDVTFTSIQMKKNRPGTMLCCLCRKDVREAVLRCIFKNTTSLGVREYDIKRYSLDRCFKSVETKLGPIRVKKSEGYGTLRSKAEFDDLAVLARQNGLSLLELKSILSEGSDIE